MNQEFDLDLVLNEWFSDGANTVSNRVMDEVAERIGHQPQHGAWRFHRRWIVMNPTLKIAMAAAAVLVLVVVGFAVVLRQGPGIGGGGVVP